jgi:hypothetical protein
MAKPLSAKNIYEKKHTCFEFDGIWKEIMGSPEKSGAWLIWGSEKNGKTWFTLLLSYMLSDFEKVLYISAEEGLGKDFCESIKRAKINPLNKSIQFIEYEPLEDIGTTLKKQRAAKIVVIDNITTYNEELKNGAFRKLLLDFPEVLFIFLAHEDRGEPYTATAKLVKRVAKLIFYIEGLTCNVSGRCPGGTVIVDKERAALFHGNSILKQV